MLISCKLETQSLDRNVRRSKEESFRKLQFVKFNLDVNLSILHIKNLTTLALNALRGLRFQFGTSIW